MNREDQLFIAKKTAERAGYKVTMPDERRAPDRSRFNRMSREEYNNRINRAPQRPANPDSVAGQLSQLALAARTAEEAGYKVRKATPVEQAKQVAQDAGYKVVKKDDAEPPKTDEQPKNPYLTAAAKFLQREE
jgi:hypothetical protein